MAKEYTTTAPSCPKCNSTELTFTTTRTHIYEVQGLDTAGLILDLVEEEEVEEGAGDTFSCLSCEHKWPRPRGVEYRKEE